MLTFVVPDRELWDSRNERFISFHGATVSLEHSLVSISKWESKHHKAFLGKQTKTEEEILDYILCMSVDGNMDQNLLLGITDENVDQIKSYIDDRMSATYLPDTQAAPSQETITSELIYYWMISLNIPFECQYWHLNRLLTLIRVCGVKNQPPKKMGRTELMRRNASLNAARRNQWHTKG